jgi:hypothetical protein
VEFAGRGAVSLSRAGALLSASRPHELDRRPLFSFKWPSVVYALDILGWDIFFPLSMWFAAPVFSGSGRATSIR